MNCAQAAARAMIAAGIPGKILGASSISGRQGYAFMGLEAADLYDDQAFAEYGVSEEDIADLRRWAQGWADDIRRRLYTEDFDFGADDH